MDKIENKIIKNNIVKLNNGSDICDTCIYKKYLPYSGHNFTHCTFCHENNPIAQLSFYKKAVDNVSKNYDEHYNTSNHQSIEVIQANMTPEEFIGHLKGNIIKYVLRMGRKDDVKKEAAKIRRYAQWLEQAVNGETIDPRK